MCNVPWTNEENDTLKSMLGVPIEEIAEKMGRTVSAIRHQMQILGMGMKKGRLIEKKNTRKFSLHNFKDDEEQDRIVTESLRNVALNRGFYR